MLNTIPMIALLRTCLLAVGVALFHVGMSHADSKRIEVRAQHGPYYDVKPGDTLGEIATKLTQGNLAQRRQLMDEIFAANPDAFIDGNRNLVKLGARLWLPGYIALHKSADSQLRQFSWGYIRTPTR